MQSHSQTVDYRKRCDGLPFTKCATSLTFCWEKKRCDEAAFHKMCVTHLLGKDVMSPFPKMCNLSLTCCWSWEKKDMMKLPFMCNVTTHKLLVIGKERYGETAFHVQCHSQPVGDRKRCDEINFHKMCNVTHSLHARKRCDDTAFQKVQCHSLQTVDHT